MKLLKEKASIFSLLPPVKKKIKKFTFQVMLFDTEVASRLLITMILLIYSGSVLCQDDVEANTDSAKKYNFLITFCMKPTVIYILLITIVVLLIALCIFWYQLSQKSRNHNWDVNWKSKKVVIHIFFDFFITIMFLSDFNWIFPVFYWSTIILHEEKDIASSLWNLCCL